MAELSPASRPGVLRRAVSALRYTITGAGSETWMPPMQPLAPMAPESVRGRQFDFPVGYNLAYVPRSAEPVGVRAAAAAGGSLRRAAAGDRAAEGPAGGARLVGAAARDPAGGAAGGGGRSRGDPGDRAGSSPCRTGCMTGRRGCAWCWRISTSSTRCRSIGGGTAAVGSGRWSHWTGATIKVLLDGSGRRPLPPDPAYQQVLKGIPAVDYAADELLYAPRNPRTSHVYGYSAGGAGDPHRRDRRSSGWPRSGPISRTAT